MNSQQQRQDTCLGFSNPHLLAPPLFSCVVMSAGPGAFTLVQNESTSTCNTLTDSHASAFTIKDFGIGKDNIRYVIFTTACKNIYTINKSQEVVTSFL